MKDWPSVELTGKEFVIPRVCPNCMAPAEHGWGTTHAKGGMFSKKRATSAAARPECLNLLMEANAAER